MPAPRARHIPQLLDIHAEDLAFLWGQRRAALDSPEQTLRDIAQLNERIEAHVQGLLIAPSAELAARLQTALAGADRDDVFAAATAALRCDDAAVARSVITEFSRAGGPSLLGLRDALGHTPAALLAAPMREAVAGELRNALEHAKPTVAAAAAVALVHQRQLAPDAPGLARLLLDEDGAVCAAAWAAAWRADRHAAAAAGGRAGATIAVPAGGAASGTPSTSSSSTPRPYREALSRPEPAVRHEAWASAAWAGLTQSLAALRRAAADGDGVALHWLAMLGTPEDTKTIGAAAMALPTPAERCTVLARYGHPAVLPTLLRWMEGDDAVTAHAAGVAFTRITGAAIDGERRTLPVPDDADEIDREMAPLVWMPDAAKARAVLKEQGARLDGGSRWCMGRRMDVAFGAEELASLDLQARWDVAARAALAGRPVSAPPPVV